MGLILDYFYPAFQAKWPDLSAERQVLMILKIYTIATVSFPFIFPSYEKLELGIADYFYHSY